MMDSQLRITSAPTQVDLDKAGAVASLTCAVHCALMPLVITLLPLVGLSFLADERMEWVLLGVSAVLGSSSLCLGYREHRKRQALLILALGLTALVMGRLLEEHHFEAAGVAGVVLGGCTVAAAHFVNRRLCFSCRSCRVLKSTKPEEGKDHIYGG